MEQKDKKVKARKEKMKILMNQGSLESFSDDSSVKRERELEEMEQKLKEKQVEIQNLKDELCYHRNSLDLQNLNKWDPRVQQNCPGRKTKFNEHLMEDSMHSDQLD